MFKIYPIISNTYKSKWNNEITELKFVYIIYIFFYSLLPSERPTLWYRNLPIFDHSKIIFFT